MASRKSTVKKAPRAKRQSATDRKTGRKARKPKFIEIRGHRLTEAMHADYMRCVESRGRTNASESAEQIRQLGLEDFLAGYRPSRKIKGQVSALAFETTRVGLAVGAMDGYTFFSCGPKAITSAGCKLLKDLALELYNTSAKVTAIAMSVETERTTKLQDWLARDEEIARIGQGAEVTHG